MGLGARHDVVFESEQRLSIAERCRPCEQQILNVRFVDSCKTQRRVATISCLDVRSTRSQAWVTSQ